MAGAAFLVTQMGPVLAKVETQRLSGGLELGNGRQRWWLWFLGGRLLFATGGAHRYRRWRRLTKRVSPELSQARGTPEKPWEYDALAKAVEAGTIAREQAQQVIRGYVTEVLFDLAQTTTLAQMGVGQVRGYWDGEARLSKELALLVATSEWRRVEQLWQQWQQVGLRATSPDMAPQLHEKRRLEHRVSPQTYLTLNRLCDGEHTFWDLAAETGAELPLVGQSLLALVREGYFRLQTLEDLAPPPESVQKPVVACVDDSPACLQNVVQALGDAFHLITLEDPLRGLGTLIQARPHVILLDWLFPQVNGLEICSLLRKSPVLKDVPIVLLTANGGLLDRARARLAGANEVLEKPATPEQLRATVERYLAKAQA
ncbi:MAG: response regulator [Gloeomargarita sp. SKYG116]|nr:response regulator [Gloeomargarita sp. SKYG116]MCS7225397.1 response regulator [Gloeomargarita sp. SKYB31]MDW8401641.1 response regulator [Gloeomargarita sp. SKYGB_i_bin116]